MHPNQFYRYLNYILEKRINAFPIRQCQARSGQKYLYIPLLEQNASFIHSEYGEVRVKDSHLSCFEELSEKSHYSDIHFTCTIITSTDEIKVHIYQDEEGNNIGIYIKNLNHPEQVFVLSFDDLKILNDSAKKLTMQLRHEFLNFLKRTQAQYEQVYYEYHMMTIREQDELEPQIEQIKKILQNLEILSLFKPENYQASLMHFIAIKTEKIQLLEQQKSIEAAREATLSAHTLQVQKQFLDLDMIKTTREFCYILDKVLQQNVIKLDISKGRIPVIHHQFEEQVKESIKIYQLIQEHLALLDPMTLSPEALTRYQYCLIENERILVLLKDICTSYFNTMVLCQNYRDMDLIEPFLNRPNGVCIRNIIKNEPQEILPRLINRFQISLTARVLDVEPYSIIEYTLQENKLAIFAELVHYFSIDYTYRLADNRPLVMILNTINQDIAWKLFENYEHNTLASAASESEQEAVRASIAARTAFLAQSRSSENRSFINQLMPGVMKGVSENLLALEYEYSYATGRIFEIEKRLKDFRDFPFAINLALVEEKNKLLMITMLCSAVSSQYSNSDYLKKVMYFKSCKSLYEEKPVEYYAQFSDVSVEILENIRLAKEYVKLFINSLPGNSYHIIALIYFDKLVINLQSMLEHQSPSSAIVVQEVDSLILAECERIKSIL